MSKSIRRNLLQLFFGLLCFCAAHGFAIGQPNAFEITRNLLNAFYPEMFGKERYISLSSGRSLDDNSWTETFELQFRITPFPPGSFWNPGFDQMTNNAAQNPNNTTLLRGSSWVGRNGELVKFAVEGELAHSHENEKIRRLVESHPDWSEEQAIRALKDAGAQFGPAEEKQLMDSLNFQMAENYLGRIKIKLVEFEGLSSEHVGNFARLYWIIQAQGEYSDGHHRTYGFSFEPFGGKLTGLHDIADRKYDDRAE